MTQANLTLHVYDDSAALWQHLTASWRDDRQSHLYFPSPLSRDHFLRQVTDSGTIWHGHTDTILALWRQAGQALEQQRESAGRKLPRTIPARAAEPLLEQLLRQLGPPLDKLAQHPTGAAALLAYLEHLERQVDQDYGQVAQTSIEQAIQQLRELLAAQDWAVSAGYRSQVAREAYHLQLSGQLLIAPLPDLSPHLGGLLRGLARHNRISAWLLTNAANLDELLWRTNLAEATANINRHFSDSQLAGRIFAPEQTADSQAPSYHVNIPTGQNSNAPRSLIKAEWLIAEDELEAAFDQLQTWQAAGYSLASIGLVMPNPAERTEQLTQLTSERQLPIILRPPLRAVDTSIGSLLRQLAAAPLDEASCQTLVVGDGARYQLQQAHLDQLVLARQHGPLAELENVQQLGQTLLEGRSVAPPFPADLSLSHLWLEALQRAYADLSSAQLQQLGVSVSCLTLIDQVEGSRQAYGDATGTVVVSYGEAASYHFERVIALGLGTGSFPPTRTRSPFVSEALLRQLPRLRPALPRAEFVAAVASASQAVLFIQESADLSDNGSAFWQASRQAAGLNAQMGSVPGYSSERPDVIVQAKGQGRSAQRSRQRAARQRLDHGQQLRQILGRASREELPQGYFHGERTAFSVTELETYLSCPRGWFVRHVLQIRSPANLAARRGTIAHDILADVFQDHVEEPGRDEGDIARSLARRQELLKQLLQDRTHEFSTISQAQLAQQLQRLLVAYSQPRWPFNEHYTEVSLQAQGLLTQFPDYLLRGRVDRIDSDQEHFLVIDYKSKWSNQTRYSTLQPFLYPLMAQQQGPVQGQSPLGAVYLSLLYTQHKGWLSDHAYTRYPQIVNDLIRSDWPEQADEAQDRASQAIARITAGDWAEKGTSCPDWCPHHLLSETVAVRLTNDDLLTIDAEELDQALSSAFNSEEEL